MPDARVPDLRSGRARAREAPLRAGAGALAVVAALATAPSAAPSASPYVAPIAGAQADRRPEPRAIVIVASGDILVHAPVANAAAVGAGRYDFRPLFAPIRPILRRADLALCHVETPIGAGPRSGYPLFNAPAELASAIRWAGWDACSTASNHSLDRGAAGVATTIRLLRGAGLRVAGTSRSRRESRRITRLRVRGVDVALLSYTYGTNGLPLPAPWMVNLIDARRIAADARRARRRGADLVLANLHWGVEYVHAPTGDQRALARRLLRPGLVDVVLGQHAHVVQPIRRVGRRFVVYGEGNLLSAQSIACCAEATRDGLIAVVRARRARRGVTVTRVDYYPTRVSRPGYTVEAVGIPLRRLLASGQARTTRAFELLASYRRTASVAGWTRFTRPLPRLRLRRN